MKGLASIRGERIAEKEQIYPKSAVISAKTTTESNRKPRKELSFGFDIISFLGSHLYFFFINRIISSELGKQ